MVIEAPIVIDMMPISLFVLILFLLWITISKRKLIFGAFALIISAFLIAISSPIIGLILLLLSVYVVFDIAGFFRKSF